MLQVAVDSAGGQVCIPQMVAIGAGAVYVGLTGAVAYLYKVNERRAAWLEAKVDRMLEQKDAS